jgi:hypothetical protein
VSAINYDDLIAQLQQRQDRANNANRRRYQQLLDTIDQTSETALGSYNEAMGLVDTLGHASRRDIDRGAQRTAATADQDLITRGLGNTTIRSSVQRGVEDDRAMNQLRLQESLAAQRAGLLTQRAGLEVDLGSLMAQAIEGRYDDGPDLGLYAQLLQASAAAGNQQPINASVGGGSSTGGMPSLWQQSQDRHSAATSGGGSPGGSSSGPRVISGGSGGVSDNGRIITNPNAQPSVGGWAGPDQPMLPSYGGSQGGGQQSSGGGSATLVTEDGTVYKQDAAGNITVTPNQLLDPAAVQAIGDANDRPPDEDQGGWLTELLSLYPGDDQAIDDAAMNGGTYDQNSQGNSVITPESTLDGESLSRKYRKYRAENPFYLKSFAKWKRDHGYTD